MYIRVNRFFYMIQKINGNRGIGPLIIIIIAAVVLGGGAGTYKVVQKNKEKKTMANVDVTASTTVNGMNGTSTAQVEVKNSGTLRALIAQNKNLMCTVKSDVSGTSSEGTVYLSGSDFRGDFVTKSSGTTVNSHMIKMGQTMYAWSDGGQGVKMDATASANSNASAQTMDLDQKVSYDCKDWTKDASKFVVPTSIEFLDVNAMLKAQGNVQIPKLQ
jgi:hypothetical protein